MATKGFNCILFDFDSIVDKEASLMKYFYGVFKGSKEMNQFMEIDELKGVTDDVLKFARMYGKKSMFQELLIKQEDKDRYRTLIELFFDRDQKDIFDNNYAITTAMLYLLLAYKKAGGGFISTTVRCDNQDQVDFIHDNINRSISTIISKREEVDMSKYANLVVGYYRSAFQYDLKEPKNITILSFVENYDIADDGVKLKPDLIIGLGDVNDIRIASAYREDEFINNESKYRKEIAHHE